MKKETNLFKIEACIGTLQSGLEAEKGGANRVELCDNLAEGGTTPSAALIQMTKEKLQRALKDYNKVMELLRSIY